MADYSFFDEDFFSDISPGIPIDAQSFDIRNILGSVDLGNIDFSGLTNYDQGDFYDFGYGDSGGIADLGNIDFSGLTNYDQGDVYDFGYGDSGGIADLVPTNYDQGDFYDFGYGDLGGSAANYDQGDFYDFGYGDVLGSLGYPDPQDQDGGFYGNTSGAYFDPRTNLTTLYDEAGKLRDFVTHEDGVARIGGGSADVESQPGGFYGNTPTSTYNPQTNTTTVRNPTDGSTRVIDHGTGSTTTYPPGTQPPKQPPGNEPPIKPSPPGSTSPPKTPITKDNALLIALLGGLMGLLGKGSAPKLPVGYQGGIPKYTATRVPGRGVQYTRAAGGGLMDLAGGGTARYLRGGTDGMADKIKTSIDNKQPARLSSGEFVIPADVVGALGSGNSEAGANVLYDMMDRVRKHAHGHTKQIKQANPKKVLPA